MKFDNKLNLVEYLQVVSEITSEFFDEETYEYTPQIGEMYALCLYFNHCVEIEENDGITLNHITDISDMEQLYGNEELMKHYEDEIWSDVGTTALTFGNAYEKAKEIVEYKKNDANAFATAITESINAILKSFRESFTEEDVMKISDIAKQITSGKLSNESIVKAYENSSRFKDNTKELNDSQNIVQFPTKE